MVYLTYDVVFKSGKDEYGKNSQSYMIEIEPHEYEEAHKTFNENQIKFSNQFHSGISSLISFDHTEGFAMFSTEEVSRVNIKGMENLKHAIENS